MYKVFNYFLQNNGYETVSSCCGHGKYPLTVVVKYKINNIPFYKELFTQIDIPRFRRFYKTDNEGYYYIPEVSKHGFKKVVYGNIIQDK